MDKEDRALHYVRMRLHKGKIVWGLQGEEAHYTFQLGCRSEIFDVHKTKAGSKSETLWAARHSDVLGVIQEVSLDELLLDIFTAIAPADYTWLVEGNIWLAEFLDESEVTRQLDKNNIPVAIKNMSPSICPLPSGLFINRLCENVYRKYSVYEMQDDVLDHKGTLLQIKGDDGHPFWLYVGIEELLELIDKYSEQSAAILDLFDPDVLEELEGCLRDLSVQA